MNTTIQFENRSWLLSDVEVLRISELSDALIRKTERIAIRVLKRYTGSESQFTLQETKLKEALSSRVNTIFSCIWDLEAIKNTSRESNPSLVLDILALEIAKANILKKIYESIPELYKSYPCITPEYQ